MSSWPHQPISSLGIVITGSTPKTSEDHFYGGDIPFVTPAELDQTDPIMNAARTLSETGSQESRLLPEGTVMVCCIGSLGKVGIAGRTVASNQQINSVIFDPKIIWPRFGFYACRLLKSRLETLAPATTVPIVNKSKFGQLEIPVPPIEEQKRIADILDRAEALRAKRRAALTQLDELTQSIFREMFGDPARNTKNLPTISLGELGDWQSGGTPPRGREDYFEGPVSWFSSGELEEMFLFKSKEHISEKALSETSAKSVPKGALMLGMYDTAALKASIAGVDCSCNQAIAFATLNPEIAETVFVYFAIVIGREHFRRLQRGVRQKNLNLSMVREISIPLPPLSLQKEFIRRVEAIEKLKTAHKISLTGLNELFLSLQHRAFRCEYME
jgi:type I restriction enzyme S subunit